MMELKHRELTAEIIGVYYDVYNGLGRTYPEFIYERAMMEDLVGRGIGCQRQPEYELRYKDLPVGGQRLDLFVAGDVVVELKVAEGLTRQHKAQAFSYLKVVGKEIGLLFNFGCHEPEFERIYYRDRRVERQTLASTAGGSEDLLMPDLTHDVIGALFEVHNVLGPGFVHRIYGNALYHELRLRGHDVRPRQVYEVIYRNRPVGAIKFGHLLVDGCMMVFPVAMQDMNGLSLNNLKGWMRDRQISIGIMANFYPTKLEFKVLRV